MKWGNNSAFLPGLLGESHGIIGVKCLAHNPDAVSGTHFIISPTCSSPLLWGAQGPSLLSCVTQGTGPFLAPLSRVVEDQLGFEPGVSPEGGLRRTGVPDSPSPRSCQELLGLVGNCKLLTQPVWAA